MSHYSNGMHSSLDVLERIAIDRDSITPIYYQISQVLRSYILSGQLKPGDYLPPEKSFHASCGVNHITIRKAFKALESEGLIERKKGVGTRVNSPGKWSPKQAYKILLYIIWEAGTGSNQVTVENSIALLTRLAETYDLRTEIVRINPYKQNILEVLGEISFDAIMFQTFGYRPIINDVFSLECPKVVLQEICYESNCDSVTIDSLPGVYDAVSKLLDIGHRDIAFIGGLLYYRTKDMDKSDGVYRIAGDSYSRLNAFRKAFEDRFLHFNPARYYELPFDKKVVGQWVQELLKANQLPSAIFTFDDNLAAFIYAALKHNKIRIPEDVSLVGFGNVISHQELRLSTVNISWEKMYELGLERLRAKFNQGTSQSTNLSVPSEFLPKQTIAPGPNREVE